MQASNHVRVVAAHLADGDEAPMAVLPVAVPYYLVRLTVICVERRELSVFREFMLRALHLGFDNTTNLANFLGVAEDEARTELVELASELFIASSAKGETFSLMEKGLRAISATGLTRVVIRETGCYVHGATRKVELVPVELFPRRRLPSDALVLPGIPARPPRIDELDLLGVKASIMATRNSLPRLMEVSRLGRVVRTNVLFRTGYVLLRRGARSLPQICVDRASDFVLAQVFGSHPALQQVKSIVERHDKLVKRTISQHRPEMREARVLPSTSVRNALAKFVIYADADASKVLSSGQAFIQATDALVSESSWLGVTEAQTLFARAIASARSQLLIAAPPLSLPLFDRGALESLAIALRKGVGVDIHVVTGDERFSPQSELVQHFLQGANFIQMPAASEWCGFCCDDVFAVVGKTKASTCSMGRFDTFFGAVVLQRQQPKQFLAQLAINSGAPVTVKPKRRVLPTQAKKV